MVDFTTYGTEKINYNSNRMGPTKNIAPTFVVFILPTLYLLLYGNEQIETTRKVNSPDPTEEKGAKLSAHTNDVWQRNQG